MSFFTPSSVRQLLTRSIILAVVFVLPIQAVAADVEDPDAVPSPDQVAPSRFGRVGEYLASWNVVLGGGAMIAPKFEGSDEFEVLPVPFISATFGDRVTVDPRGISLAVYDYESFSLAARVGYDGGRSVDDSDHLRGLGDIDGGAVVGGKLGYHFGPVELYASLDRTIGGSEGMVGMLGADISHRFDRFLLSSGVSATWADENHMQSYFGVTPEQSARSGLPQYDAGAGFKRVDLDASVTYMATENWLIRGQVSVGYLIGDAGDSPIVQENLQPSGMLAVAYKF